MEWLAPRASFSPNLAPGFEYRINSFGATVIVAASEAPWPAGAPGAPAPAGGGGVGSGGGGGGGGGAPRAYRPSALSLDERFSLVRSVGEECIQEEELLALLKAKAHPVCYDGFEPSGRMHIAQGILKALLVNKLTAAGCVFKFWVADWFALLNDKMGGNLEHIKTVGRYMVEVWRAAGMDMTNVEFLWASDEINAHSNEYWLRVMDIARRNNLPRILRCCTIMGRAETDDLTAAQIFYPAMQCADIFHLKADICQLGMDQRKVNMLAREYCDQVKIKHKPIILSHHMLMGMKEGQEKMSKSDPDTAIFMEDSAEDVKRKIKKAYCPPGKVEGNPCLDWIKHVVFPKLGGRWRLARRAEDGGDADFGSYAEFEAAYAAGSLHPGDVKANLTTAINEFLEPVRAHFAQGEPKVLLEKVRKLKTTR